MVDAVSRRGANPWDNPRQGHYFQTLTALKFTRILTVLNNKDEKTHNWFEMLCDE
jgi:hypothetical protein